VAGNGSAVHLSVVSKVAAILRTVRFNGALTVTEIARVTNLPLSTAHRLVVELADRQLLGRADDGRYGLTWGVTRRGMGCPSGIRVMVGPTVDDLSSVTARDVRLGVLDELRVRYVEKTYGARPISIAATLPVHATALGQVLLAYSKADVVRRVVASGLRRYTSTTVTTAARLDHVLKTVRVRGIAVVNGELTPDHVAVAAPVFDGSGEIAAALEARLRDVEAELPIVVPSLTIAARSLSRDLMGGRVADVRDALGPVARVVPLGGAGGSTASLG
jgi:IclR family transcriptional regulator, acetate operon repressor